MLKGILLLMKIVMLSNRVYRDLGCLFLKDKLIDKLARLKDPAVLILDETLSSFGNELISTNRRFLWYKPIMLPQNCP